MSPEESTFYHSPTTREGTRLPRLFLFGVTALLTLVFVPTAANAQLFVKNPLQNPLCSEIGKQIQVSSGLRMYCFGSQPNGPRVSANTTASSSGATTSLSSSGTATSTSSSTGTFSFSRNVDAASLAEDVAPGGSRVYGQSEVSIAASGSHVVEAWNDGTGFFSPCPSAMNKEELTGAGFSNDGGNSFTDIGGLPNSNCANDLLFGDPSVEVLQMGGTAYFYISSLYLSVSSTDPTNKLAINVCTLSGTGPLSCGQPVIAAKSSECIFVTFCSFLDKEFLTIDPARNRLYISYTEFGFTAATAAGAIELAACDITNPGVPVCENGSNGPIITPAPPYLVVATADPNCEQEGAYPAADRAIGDVYVAYEFNWVTNGFSPCNSSATPVANVMTYVAFTPCLGPAGPPSPTSPCTPPRPNTSVAITSMDFALIPGYNRFPMNDFPRVAVSNTAGTVSMVWNDAGTNPGGSILLQSFGLGSSLAPTTLAPVKINNDNVAGTFHFLPAVRNVDSNGLLSVSWFDRRLNPNTALTDVFAAVEISPLITSTPKFNQRVTDASSNWLAASSDIVPNFGDYTDNYVFVAPASATGAALFVAWSDGRLNDPQPFESHAGLSK